MKPVLHVREAGVDDLPLVAEPKNLHHAA